MAQALGDEAAQDIGELVVLSADGVKATATVNRTLEVVNASSAVLATNGGSAVINGKVSSTSAGTPDSSALALQSGATDINNGVINGGFLNLADDTGVDSATVNNAVFSYTVLMGDNSRFRNNGVVNTAGKGTALGIFAGSAINNGHIVIGSLTQGSTAMRVEAGPNARLQNNGFIDVNGRADFRPEENIAMPVIDSGSGGLVGNAGNLMICGPAFQNLSPRVNEPWQA